MDLSALVARADPDELLREIDACVERRDWEGLLALRDRCDAAVERGHQLWPVANHAEYRLALDAPGEWAAAVLVDAAGRFAPGPLAEVASERHEWSELEPFVTPGPVAVLALHERVVRGEDLRACAVPGPEVIDVPRVLSDWEPQYALAEYRADRADFPSPPPPDFGEFEPLVGAPVVADLVAVDALLALVRAWTVSSDARAQAVAVAGDARAAVGALGVGSARFAPISHTEAFAWMAWAAANGGANGRRRGAALGRYDAWCTASALCGFDGPATSRDLADAIVEVNWYLWTTVEPPGWVCNLAVEDRADGCAWALTAVDAT